MKGGEGNGYLWFLLVAVFFFLLATGRATLFRPGRHSSERDEQPSSGLRMFGWGFCGISLVLATIAFIYR